MRNIHTILFVICTLLCIALLVQFVLSLGTQPRSSRTDELGHDGNCLLAPFGPQGSAGPQGSNRRFYGPYFKGIMEQHPNYHGEKVQSAMVIALGGSVLFARNDFTEQDQKEAQAWRETGRLGQVLSPFDHSYPGEAWDGESKTSFPKKHSCHQITKMIRSKYSAGTVEAAMLDWVDTLAERADPKLHELLDQELRDVGSNFVAVFIRNSTNKPKRNISVKDVRRVCSKYKHIVLVGDELTKAQEAACGSTDVINLSQPRLTITHPLSQFIVLRALRKKGVRVLVGKWSGWLFAVCFGFCVKVIGYQGNHRFRSFMRHFVKHQK